MASQESIGESRVSNPAPEPRANSDADHFGPAMEEEMEANLMRVDAMEDQEVTSRLRAGFTMGELQSSAIPNSVIPSNVRFLSYENMKRSAVTPPIQSYTNHARKCVRSRSGTHGKISQHNSKT